MITCQACESPAESNLCASCTGQLARALGDLPALLSALSGVVTRQARVHRTIGAPREPDPDWRGGEHALIRTPWAINPDASAELDRVGNELAGWTKHICEQRGVRPTGTLGVAHWLLANLDAITLDEAADEILTEITQLRADLLRAVDNSPSPFYAGPCHALVDEPSVTVRAGVVFVATVRRKCERDLYAFVNPWATDRDDAKITCKGWRSDEEGCGTVHTVADRQDWLIDSMEDALLTIDEVQAALPRMLPDYPRPPKTVIQAWVRQGRLVAKTVSAGGLERFRGGDMLDLIQAYKPRVFAPRSRRSA